MFVIYFKEEDRKMRSLAVIPPMMLDARQRSLRYYNNNGLVEDAMADWKERKLINIWTPQEKHIFRERYLQHPKNFGAIASYLERKVTQYSRKFSPILVVCVKTPK